MSETGNGVAKHCRYVSSMFQENDLTLISLRMQAELRGLL